MAFLTDSALKVLSIGDGKIPNGLQRNKEVLTQYRSIFNWSSWEAILSSFINVVDDLVVCTIDCKYVLAK